MKRPGAALAWPRASAGVFRSMTRRLLDPWRVTVAATMADDAMYEIARSVVEKHAPEEIEDFDAMFEDFTAGRLDTSPRPRQHASGATVLAEITTVIVLQVVAQILATRADRGIDAIIARIRKTAKTEQGREAAPALAPTIAHEVAAKDR
jgi:hypothetical protein